MGPRARDDVPGQIFQFATIESIAEGKVGREERQGDFGLGLGREPDLGRLGASRKRARNTGLAGESSAGAAAWICLVKNSTSR